MGQKRRAGCIERCPGLSAKRKTHTRTEFFSLWAASSVDDPTRTLVLAGQRPTMLLLRIRRTRNGEELNHAIATMLASEALAIERYGADWRARELAANRFQWSRQCRIAAMICTRSGGVISAKIGWRG
jgi:hypothetical protein